MPTRIVFDPFSDIRHLARDLLSYRRQVLALRDFFTEYSCIVLLMHEMTRGRAGDVQLETLTHGYDVASRLARGCEEIARLLSSSSSPQLAP